MAEMYYVYYVTTIWVLQIKIYTIFRRNVGIVDDYCKDDAYREKQVVITPVL